jgi:hypothetical protein
MAQDGLEEYIFNRFVEKNAISKRKKSIAGHA